MKWVRVLVAAALVALLVTAGSCDTPGQRNFQQACDKVNGVVVVTDIGEGHYACLVGDGLHVVPL